MNKQCQYLSEYQWNDPLRLLQKIEDFSDRTLGTWKMDSIYLYLKQDTSQFDQNHTLYQMYMKEWSK